MAAGYLRRAEAVRAGLDEGVDDAALHRLDEVLTLGIAASVDPENRDIWYRSAIALLRQWRAAVRPGGGMAFETELLARRKTALVQAHSFFAAELRSDACAPRELSGIIYAAGQLLAAQIGEAPSTVALIAAGRALFLAGRLFDGLEARAWLEKGTSLLWGQLREQILEDGGHRDRIPPVHVAVLADYLHVFAVLLAGDEGLPVWGRKRVKSMADFLVRLRHPDGSLVGFHGHPGITVPPVGELLVMAGVLLDELAFARAGGAPGLWTRLWLGEVRGDLGGGVDVLAPVETRALRRTRYYVLAGGPGDVMFIDGDLPGPSGQANAFGYELSVGGERLVVTGGAPPRAGNALAEYVRGPRAHNVMTIPGRAGGSGAGEVSSLHWTVRHGLVCFSATRDGLVDGAAGPLHRRRVVGLPGRFWIVCDELLGAGFAAAESYVHFHPDVVMTAICRGRPGFLAARGARSWAQVAFAGGCQVGLVAGAEEPVVQGWASLDASELRPAPTLVLGGAGRLPLLLGYAILPRTDVPARLDLAYEEVELRVRLSIGTERFEIAVPEDSVELRRPAS